MCLLQLCTQATGLKLKMYTFVYKKGWQTFAIKNEIGFVSYMVFVATTQFCCSSVAINDMKMKGCGCVLITFYLQKEMMDGTWPEGHNIC